MSGFITRIDYSSNRQIKQQPYTSTDLSGTTVFGLEYSALTAGVDLETVSITSTLANVETTFSGNSQETIFDFPDARMVVASGSLTVITDTNSGDTQNAIAFEGSEFFELDGNIVNTAYTGSSFDLTVTEIVDDGLSGWTGTANSTLVQFLSGSSLDFQDRTIWVDVKGITKTEKLIIDKLPVKDNTLQSVLGRQADGDVVEVDLTEIKSLFRATYAEYETIIANNELIVGNRYILTDYKTIYQIENTNTSPIIEYHTILGPSSVWAYFGVPGISSVSLKNGDVVTIVELPDGYGGSHYVGETVTTIDYYNNEYIRFSPTTNETGIVIKIETPRWSNITDNDTITDISGNTIMQSGGVLNTEVHNDLPYMDMTASENPSPKTEEIILTAIDTNKFSIEAESLTYLGDTLLYYFEDNEIYDENDVLIGNRNGLIKKREAFDLNISVDKDWRTQRYRRWKVTDDWNNFTLQKDVYKVSGVNICTTVNVINEGHKYVAPKVVNENFYLDFYSSGNTNPFLSGTTWAPGIEGSGRSSNDTAPEYSKDIIIPFSGITSAKDFHIFPIIDEKPTSFTPIFKVKNLENTICLTESQRYGASANYFVNSTGSITNSSFMSGININSNGGNLSEITSVDSMRFYLGANSYTSKVRAFSYGNLTNNGSLRNCMFGGSRSGENDFTEVNFDDSCVIYNSIFGTIRNDNTTFTNLQANKLLHKIRFTANSKYSGNVYLTEIQMNPKYWGINIELDTFVYTNPVKGKYGYLYTINGDMNSKRATNFYGNKNLIYESSDDLNIVQLITKATLQ